MFCQPAPVFRPAGFTPPPRLYAASELRLFRRRGFSLALLTEVEHFNGEIALRRSESRSGHMLSFVHVDRGFAVTAAYAAVRTGAEPHVPYNAASAIPCDFILTICNNL